MSDSTTTRLPVAGLDAHAASIRLAEVREDELLDKRTLPFDCRLVERELRRDRRGSHHQSSHRANRRPRQLGPQLPDVHRKQRAGPLNCSSRNAEARTSRSSATHSRAQCTATRRSSHFERTDRVVRSRPTALPNSPASSCATSTSATSTCPRSARSSSPRMDRSNAPAWASTASFVHCWPAMRSPFTATVSRPATPPLSTTSSMGWLPQLRRRQTSS